MDTSKFTDRDYLKNEQYRDGRHLRSRISLHERFSTNPRGWHLWVFDQFDLPPAAAILEIGCGPGRLWSQNSERIPAGWRLFLSDLSLGMVREARFGLGDPKNCSYICLDISHPPLTEGYFDAIIANHMLYHVPDVGHALTTIHGLLKPGGLLYATTNGRTHLQEMTAFVRQARGDQVLEGDNVFQHSLANFTLQTGRQQLLVDFASVELRTYPDSLEVDDAKAIIQFVESSLVFDLPATGLDRLREHLQKEIELNGAVTITKESGIFIARKSGNI